MSVLQYPSSIDVKDVQIWNNAAFDNGDTETTSASSSSIVQSLSFNDSEIVELDSHSSKENFSPPRLCRSPVCLNSSVKPLHPNIVNGNSHGKPLKVLFKEGLLLHHHHHHTGNDEIRDVSKIDAEMEEIEKEICRLSLKLESLRVEKEEMNVKQIERIEPLVGTTPKFVEQKQSSRVSLMPKKIGGIPGVVSNGISRKGMSMGPSEIVAGARSQRVKQELTPIQSGKSRRGISLGPSEIAAGVRSQRKKQEITPILYPKSQRGISMGPSEIFAGIKSQPRGMEELTPIQSSKLNRRKSCFYKLQEVDEETVIKDKGGRSRSLSPKSRQALVKTQASKQRFTTIGSNKNMRKDDRVLSSIQPKNLFKEGEKSAPAKRSIKSGRVVASRYNQSSVEYTRKMSLPGNDKGGENKKRASSTGKTRVSLPESGCKQDTENKVELASEAMRYKSLTHSNPPSILKVADFLPKIRTNRSIFESPRDSGPAKKAAELMGKKSYFGEEKSGLEVSVCQTLSFDDDEEE
ncbi:hypothetical protein FRX31_017064 [Thalictrum thalictroides]|uniref:Uncharacterized protein n=1 Tax=Thalictrum thalictroides TaxID=46969 RepID=A0A7J6W7Y2_THATH|nr:hypothetical protein FRX31_017064 [Thalictrum thalictroides]